MIGCALMPAGAQEKNNAPIASYKVEYRIRDGSDAASKNGRRYTMLMDTSGRGTFKVGERVPVATGSFQPGTGGTGVSPLVNTQFNYLDVGVNIDTNVKEQDGKVALFSSMDISTIVEHKQQAGSTVLSNPTVAQIRIVVSTQVTPGKPTLIASIDDPVTQHHFDVEAVVTKE
jgi:general secretion pathway protein D